MPSLAIIKKWVMINQALLLRCPAHSTHSSHGASCCTRAEQQTQRGVGRGQNSSRLSAPCRGNPAGTPTASQECCATKTPSATQTANSPFFSTGERTECSVIIQRNKERSERALRQVKYLEVDLYYNLISCSAAFLFLLFDGLIVVCSQQEHWK